MFLLAQIQLHLKHICKGCALILGFFPPALGTQVGQGGVQYFVDNEAELFAPESDFDGVPAGSQEKGQVLLHKLQ